MIKNTITFQGVDYIVRTLDVRGVPTFEGDEYAQVNVAEDTLAIELAWQRDDYRAEELDDEIFFYVPADLLRRDATDEEIVEYLKQNLP